MLAALEPETLDDGLNSARKGLERLCIATRTVRPVSEMIRFVAGPDGSVTPDIERKLPGRGIWASATREAVAEAIRDKSFQRAFRGKAEVRPDLIELVDRLLEKSALEALSLANKAGQVVTGAMRVEEALATGKVTALLHASDAAVDGVRKLGAAARAATSAGGQPAEQLKTFRGGQLDLALGRANVVHAALFAHPASAGFLSRCLRLERWRTGGTDRSGAPHSIPAVG